jgi:hypothetical protein
VARAVPACSITPSKCPRSRADSRFSDAIAIRSRYRRSGGVVAAYARAKVLGDRTVAAGELGDEPLGVGMPG